MPSSGGGEDEKSTGMDTNTNPKKILFLMPEKDVYILAKKYRTEMAAGFASMLATLLSQPFDFTKSRMQSYNTKLIHTVQDAYRAEGLRGFWRGVGPPLLSVTVVRTTSFSVYQRTKYALDKASRETFGKSPLAQANAPGSYPTMLTIATFATAGAVSGAVVTTLSCPFELTKLSEQLAGKEARKAILTNNGATPPPPPKQTKQGAWNTARRLVHERGIAP
jgi:solute carrier family 25 (mitochondrial carnitine/acylcarnitine transporter), member 20/29